MIGCLEGGDRVPDRAPLGAPGRPGDDDLVESESLFGQLEVEQGGFVARHRHRDRRGRVADALGRDRMGAGGNARQQIAAVLLGQRADAGFRDEDLDRGEGCARLSVGYRSGQGRLLCVDAWGKHQAGRSMQGDNTKSSVHGSS